LDDIEAFWVLPALTDRRAMNLLGTRPSNLIAHDLHVPRRVDSEPDTAASHAQHTNLDLVSDFKRFVGLPGEDEHGASFHQRGRYGGEVLTCRRSIV
jgi:hypothetical protein